MPFGFYPVACIEIFLLGLEMCGSNTHKHTQKNGIKRESNTQSPKNSPGHIALVMMRFAIHAKHGFLWLICMPLHWRAAQQKPGHRVPSFGADTSPTGIIWGREEGIEESYCGRTDVFLSPLDSFFITSLNF